MSLATQEKASPLPIEVASPGLLGNSRSTFPANGQTCSDRASTIPSTHPAPIHINRSVVAVWKPQPQHLTPCTLSEERANAWLTQEQTSPPFPKPTSYPITSGGRDQKEQREWRTSHICIITYRTCFLGNRSKDSAMRLTAFENSYCEWLTVVPGTCGGIVRLPFQARRVLEHSRASISSTGWEGARADCRTGLGGDMNAEMRDG